MSEAMNDAVVHFVIGSCPLITIFPYFVIANAHNRMSDEEKDDAKISFNTLCCLLPFTYGIVFAMVYSCLGLVPRKTKNIYTRFVVSGAITSVIISLLLHYVYHIHDEWLELQNPNFCHILVGLFYLVFFYTVGQWIRSQILYGPTKPSSSIPSNIYNTSPASSSSPSSSPIVKKFEEISAKANK
jgi:hypothetical protein